MIRVTRKRLVITTLVLLLLAGILVVAWEVRDWPPPRLILKYGLPPTGGPTGRTKMIEGIEFVELKPGYFRMGSHRLCREGDLLGEIGSRLGLPWGRRWFHASDECPLRWTEVATAFWIAKTEVTTGQFRAFDPTQVSPRYYKFATCPVLDLESDHARKFCEWVGQRSGLHCRLPSVTEWEYACRAGTPGDRFFDSGDRGMEEFAWCEENCDGHPHNVGELAPNPWGLHDVYGNAAEWCSDASEDEGDTLAGGSFLSSQESIASSFRGGLNGPGTISPLVAGVRPVIVLEVR